MYNSDKHFSLYLKGIEGAAENEQAIVSQWSNHTQVSGVANEVDLADAGVVMNHLSRQKVKQPMMKSPKKTIATGTKYLSA